MAEIVPAILAKDEDEFTWKFESVKNLVKWVQLDVADGIFAPNKTWGDPETINNCDKGETSFEIHLMVADSDAEVEKWFDSGAKRIYFHHESARKPEIIIARLKSAGILPGIAILPKTPLEKIYSFLPKLNAVLLFSGKLGFYGGVLGEDALLRIQKLRKFSKEVIIEVDGGIDPATAKKCKEAGADLLVSGGYIFSNDSPKGAIKKLKQTIE